MIPQADSACPHLIGKLDETKMQLEATTPFFERRHGAGCPGLRFKALSGYSAYLS